MSISSSLCEQLLLVKHKEVPRSRDEIGRRQLKNTKKMGSMRMMKGMKMTKKNLPFHTLLNKIFKEMKVINSLSQQHNKKKLKMQNALLSLESNLLLRRVC